MDLHFQDLGIDPRFSSFPCWQYHEQLLLPEMKCLLCSFASMFKESFSQQQHTLCFFHIYIALVQDVDKDDLAITTMVTAIKIMVVNLSYPTTCIRKG